MTMTAIDEIARDVFESLEASDRATVRAVADKAGMIQFHHGAGTQIRNKYGLWEPWHPLMVDGKHPDDVSMEILHRVWELCQEVQQ